MAKSTLSLWLKDVKLAKQHKQRLAYKKLQAARRGAKKRKNKRIETTKIIKERAIKEIKKISKKEL